jgi:RNA polymerase sigma-70 factor (ECF subfamily)
VLHWCRRAGVVEPDADDVCQDVFQTVAASLDRFRRDRPGDSFRGWLHGITRHKLLHHTERRRGSPRGTGGTDAHIVLQQVADRPDLPDEPDPPEESRSLYRRALALVEAEFEVRTWQAFWRTAVDGVPAPAVAAELGLSSASVRQAKSRVLRRLREELGELID